MRRTRMALLPVVLALLLAPSIFRDATHAKGNSQVWQCRRTTWLEFAAPLAQPN
jgi:hypothetical protein